MKAIVTDIKRFAVHDGDGIRTTVFFKGCNLCCQWCHNPETISGAKQLAFYAHKCTLCGACASLCLNHVIAGGERRIDAESCLFCGKCTEVCSQDALKIFGTEMDAEAILDILLEDKAFYETSGGGVTFSGGECMLQIDFLAELLPKCKENGLHTAIDTAGNVPWAYFEKILPWTDAFLYDIKMLDAQKHRLFTGADNSRILENLVRLSESGATVWVRIPVVGGVNATEQDMRAIADFLQPLRIAKIELLPYHSLYAGKGAAICIKTPLFTTPSKEDMERFCGIMPSRLF